MAWYKKIEEEGPGQPPPERSQPYWGRKELVQSKIKRKQARLIPSWWDSAKRMGGRIRTRLRWNKYPLQKKMEWTGMPKKKGYYPHPSLPNGKRALLTRGTPPPLPKGPPCPRRTPRSDRRFFFWKFLHRAAPWTRGSSGGWWTSPVGWLGGDYCKSAAWTISAERLY